jgi:hypothetical protein
MRKPCIDDHVRVTHEIPESSVHVGDSGVIRGIWCSPNDFYDIEFHRRGSDLPGRCLIAARFVEVEEATPTERVTAKK